MAIASMCGHNVVEAYYSLAMELNAGEKNVYGYTCVDCIDRIRILFGSRIISEELREVSQE